MTHTHTHLLVHILQVVLSPYVTLRHIVLYIEGGVSHLNRQSVLQVCGRVYDGLVTHPQHTQTHTNTLPTEQTGLTDVLELGTGLTHLCPLVPHPGPRTPAEHSVGSRADLNRDNAMTTITTVKLATTTSMN